jgi:hypothetical protein
VFIIYLHTKFHNPSCSGSLVITIRLETILFTWYGYEVPGMILLRFLKGTMPLDHRKDMSLDVSAYTGYDFNTSVPVVWKLC